ncbi:MAG: hypothetical protein ACHQHP_05715 [Bacteroidia bacterium]
MTNADSFKNIYYKAEKAYKMLADIYPSLPADDPRLSTAFHLRSVLGSALVMAIQLEDLQDLSWWEKRGLSQIFMLPSRLQKELNNCIYSPHSGSASLNVANS